MATLTFVLPGRSYSRTVDDGTEQDELVRFIKGHPQDWIEVDDGEWIRRDAILSVRIAVSAWCRIRLTARRVADRPISAPFWGSLANPP
jgi:hypothetical protein